MKKILTASLVVVFVSTVAFGFQQGAPWKKFSPPAGKFSIIMPSEPTPEVEDVETDVGTMKLHLFSASTSNGYVLASYGDYPSAPADSNEAESVLDGVRDGIVNGSNSELVSENKFSFYSHPARELITKKTDQGEVIVFHCRVYLVGRRLYQLAVGTTQKDSEIPDITKFLISFDLNKSATR
jgi:hypothetical protein